MSKQHELDPEAAAWLADTIARNHSLYAGWRMEDDGGNDDGADGGNDAGASESTFTQADVDRIVADRLKRERETTKARYADYDDLKKAAEGRRTAEDRIAELERTTAEATANALRADIANKHGISAEDRDLFLTGADADTLEAQAKRLAEREADRRKAGNRVPREGTNDPAPEDPKKRFLRALAGEND